MALDPGMKTLKDLFDTHLTLASQTHLWNLKDPFVKSIYVFILCVYMCAVCVHLLCTHVCVYTCVCMYMCMHVCMYTCVWYVFTCVCMYVHVWCVCQKKSTHFSFTKHKEEWYRDKSAMNLDLENLNTYREAETKILTNE